VRLTEQEQKLVTENLGLVNVHIRRFVPVPHNPTASREYEDLFQEGCLALMQAARNYRADRHGPFSAYALSWVHHAVNKALCEGFATLRVPANAVHEARRRQRKTARSDRHRPEPALVETRRLTEEAPDGLTESEIRHPPRHVGRFLGRPWHGQRDTIETRIRAKYEAAVRAAHGRLCGSGRGRSDRDALIRRIVNERLLVPEPSARTSTRRLAQDFRCSIGRIVYCGDILAAEIRSLLEADDEVDLLVKLARRESDGMGTVIDAATASRMTRAAREGFARRFAGLAPDRQGLILRELVHKTIGSPSAFAGRLFGRLSAQDQCIFLGRVKPEARPGSDNPSLTPDGRCDPP